MSYQEAYKLMIEDKNILIGYIRTHGITVEDICSKAEFAERSSANSDHDLNQERLAKLRSDMAREVIEAYTDHDKKLPKHNKFPRVEVEVSLRNFYDQYDLLGEALVQDDKAAVIKATESVILTEHNIYDRAQKDLPKRELSATRTQKLTRLRENFAKAILDVTKKGGEPVTPLNGPERDITEFYEKTLAKGKGAQISK